MANFLAILNGVAHAAPVFVIGVSAVVIAIAPRLKVLHYPGLVMPRRKAGSR